MVVLLYPYCHSLVSLLPHPCLASKDMSSGFWVLLLGHAGWRLGVCVRVCIRYRVIGYPGWRALS